MQALVLAAGKGNRIATLTDGLPKALLPFQNKTLLEHSLDQFARSGIRDLVVVAGYQRQRLTDLVRSRWPGSVEFVFNPLYDRTNVLFSFWLALPHLREDFLYLHADTVFVDEILEALLGVKDGDVVLAVDKRRCDEEEMKVRLVEGRVAQITKRMPPEEATGEFIGLAHLAGRTLPQLRRRVEELLEEGQWNEFFESAIQRGIDRDSLDIRICDVTGLPWNEIDFEEDYEEAKRQFAAYRPKSPGR